jgi:hypothetical protein
MISRPVFTNAIAGGISTVAHVLAHPLRSRLFGGLFIGIVNDKGRYRQLVCEHRKPRLNRFGFAEIATAMSHVGTGISIVGFPDVSVLRHSLPGLASQQHVLGHLSEMLLYRASEATTFVNTCRLVRTDLPSMP